MNVDIRLIAMLSALVLFTIAYAIIYQALERKYRNTFDIPKYTGRRRYVPEVSNEQKN